MNNYLSPINLSASWTSQSQNTRCLEKISSWLYDSSSLTQKLEHLYPRVQVQVRQQITLQSTAAVLSGCFSHEEQVLLREVFLYCDNVPMIFAQTEIPLSTLTQTQGKLTEIGSDSLGRVLFQEPTMQRGEIEIAQFSQNAQIAQLCQTLKQYYKHPLWARRSLFYVSAKPLLVSELFLPAADIYLP